MNLFRAILTRSVLALAFCIVIGCAAGNQAVPSFEPQNPALHAHQAKPPVAQTLVAQADNQDDEDLLEDDWLLEGSQLDEEFYTVADPLEPYNRIIFTFNDRLYFWVVKPVALGYRAVTPPMVRTGIQNFFNNLGTPVRLANSILQGKLQKAEAEFARFLYNTTVGVLGFGNPAKKYPRLNPDPEDLGQTLAFYKIGDGFYIVWPFFGPNTLRDSVGAVGDWYVDPLFYYVDPLWTSLSLSAFDVINDLSFRIGDYESLKKAALDPYEAYRNAYIQLRQSKINQ
jgi:phospholipid-binding lipoprotein MlaA